MKKTKTTNNSNIQITLELDFNPAGTLAPVIWESIARIMEASLGRDRALAFVAEMEARAASTPKSQWITVSAPYQRRQKEPKPVNVLAKR